MASLKPVYTSYCREADKLKSVINNIGPISPVYQKLIAEIVILRLDFYSLIL